MSIHLKAADLLFVKTDQTQFSTAIAEATGDYVHVAIVAAANKIIHATFTHGVVAQTLAEFLAENPDPDVYRFDDEGIDFDTADVIERAENQLGKPYNLSFYPDAEGFYCSQLVAYAFKNQVLLPEVAMQFGDGEDLISPYWQSYYDRLGLAVPLGQAGTNPNDLSQFSKLKRIGTLSDGANQNF
ncbi:YiiX/YebB-like N1pC/P60 family cysteine hydrolase [Lactococcus insecticola]|uniref:UDP-N-acetylmuramoylalanyl-D-glutamate--2, 6-diaminopimelate ligase n=1 Tax=Pseudolactococcus insecticola TaxID=2709158 RepID=A0A6A0B692_9LACT|nr:YiiX/YebB-like N1pC/P60 family cysteine hydrolase [Lactococcus insecticola]GFH40959.1 UDP-N-acetylmuramoylalanyl-D-glutamate--2, 6-diaminopimelate ligase [Lactococcus insecticola]